MEKEQSAKKEVAAAAEQQAETTAEISIRKFGDYLILPGLKVTRDKFDTNKGKELWSYGVEVEFYGRKQLVRLQTPNVDKAETFRKSRDKYGYQVLDAMFDAQPESPLAIKLSLTQDGDVRSVEYYACGFEKSENGAELLVDHIQLVTTASSSEALLRSAINRLNIKHGWNLPML